MTLRGRPSACLAARSGSACLAGMELAPPLEFVRMPDRGAAGRLLADNNLLYSDDQYVRSWHSEDTSSKELATLALLNSARIPFFDGRGFLQPELSALTARRTVRRAARRVSAI